MWTWTLKQRTVKSAQEWTYVIRNVGLKVVDREESYVSNSEAIFDPSRHFIGIPAGEKKSCWWNAAICLTLWQSRGGRPETGRYMATLLLWIPDPVIISDSQPSGLFNLGISETVADDASRSPFIDPRFFFFVSLWTTLHRCTHTHTQAAGFPI